MAEITGGDISEASNEGNHHFVVDRVGQLAAKTVTGIKEAAASSGDFLRLSGSLAIVGVAAIVACTKDTEGKVIYECSLGKAIREGKDTWPDTPDNHRIYVRTEKGIQEE